MHIRSIGVAINCSFCSIFRVISIPFEYFSQGLSCTQVCTTTMILKSDQSATIPADGYISNTPLRVALYELSTHRKLPILSYQNHWQVDNNVPATGIHHRQPAPAYRPQLQPTAQYPWSHADLALWVPVPCPGLLQ